jgi:cytochrome c peroxidase
VNGVACTCIVVALAGVMPLAPPRVARSIPALAFQVGAAVHYDATLGGAAFVDAGKRGLRYRVRFAPESDGLVAESGQVSGVPVHPGIIRVTIVARDAAGDSAAQHFSIVIFAARLPSPILPDSGFSYSDLRTPLPSHFRFDVTGSALTEDNTPAANRTTDAGAALGRVLFYDPRLSANDRISCASCHQQQFGFADTARFSRGVLNTPRPRHTMALANARFYRTGRFFRDERAATLEAQVLQPIQDRAEMGLTLDALVLKLRLTGYYPPLFRAAFGTPEITTDRAARALAQFVRSLVSYHAPLDSVFRGGGPPNLAMLTAAEQEGRRLFVGRATCTRCHRTNALELDLPDNIGLDSLDTDRGAGDGKFKTASLRNVAVRPPYMHDGRFGTLGEVVDFYDHGIHDNPHLDPRLRGPDGKPARLNLSAAERAALIAYLETFTDAAFLHDVRFASPFREPL